MAHRTSSQLKEASMANLKYQKYIVTEMKANVREAGWTHPMHNAGKGSDGRVLWLDNEVLPGAFYLETVWAYPRGPGEPADKYPQRITDPHVHDFDEVLCFFGTNFQDPHDLAGEIEFWLDDEQYIIDYSCLIFVPRDLKHLPLVFRRIDSPVFFFTAGNSTKYTRASGNE